MSTRREFCGTILGTGASLGAPASEEFSITENDEEIRVGTALLDATVRKKGYVSGVSRQSFLDKRTGFRDPGFGLDIVDFLLEPGSDLRYRDQLDPRLAYPYNTLEHGKRAKRIVEGPQICTSAKEVSPEVVRGKDFVAVKMAFRYYLAAPGKNTGSIWNQTLVFPAGKRYFVSSDRITSANASENVALRIDMPGHARHKNGDTFSEIYLSYQGKIEAREFAQDFPPDERFHYLRGQRPLPQRFIRAYHLRHPHTGADGPWLAGMTLNPASVYEAWCHQRGYVCMIEEIWGRPIRPGETFGAAFVVGYFDSIQEMERVYDEYKGATGLELNPAGWRLVKTSP